MTQAAPATVDGPPVETVEFGLWWPAADPAELQEAAAVWRGMADHLDEVVTTLNGVARSVTAASDGEAVAAFAHHWARLGGGSGYLVQAAEDCRALATTLDDYAEAVEEARGRIQALIAEVAAAMVIGIGLSVLTAGISAAGASALASALVANAARVGVMLSMRAATIVSRVAVFAAVGSVESMAADLVLQTRRHAMVEPNKNPFQGYDLDEVLLSGAAGVVTGGVGGGMSAGIGGELGAVRTTAAPTAAIVRRKASGAASIDAVLSALPAGRSSGVKIVRTVEELEDLFRRFAAGGEVVQSAYPGRHVRLPDGTEVALRQRSQSGGPTIDIFRVGARSTKVHVDPWPPT